LTFCISAGEPCGSCRTSGAARCSPTCSSTAPRGGIPRHFIAEGPALLSATAEQGLEGVVAKLLDARYTEARRSRAWFKRKHWRRERLVVHRLAGAQGCFA